MRATGVVDVTIGPRAFALAREAGPASRDCAIMAVARSPWCVASLEPVGDG